MTAPNLMKPCRACGHQNHARKKACASCGALEPGKPEAPVVGAEPRVPAATIHVLPQAHAVHVVTRDYQTSINGVTVAYVKGQLIDNLDLAKVLMGGGAPVERIDRDRLIECPYCRKMFGRPDTAPVRNAAKGA